MTRRSGWYGNVCSIRLRAGDTLFNRGDATNYFYIVESGRLASFTDKHSETVNDGR